MKREIYLCSVGKSVMFVGFAADVRKLCSGRGKGFQRTGKNLVAYAENLMLVGGYFSDGK